MLDHRVSLVQKMFLQSHHSFNSSSRSLTVAEKHGPGPLGAQGKRCVALAAAASQVAGTIITRRRRRNTVTIITNVIYSSGVSVVVRSIAVGDVDPQASPGGARPRPAAHSLGNIDIICR